jgi:dihydrofolate reductase
MSCLSLIVAMGKNRVIGANGAIPWRLPNELQLFKRITMGHHIIMGRKTWESIGRLLQGRTTVIVTRQKDYAVPGAIIAHALTDAIKRCANDTEIFVVGGGELYREALPQADRLYLTIVDAAPAGDTLMPEINFTEWRETSSEDHVADEKHAHAYRFQIYDRLSA